MSLVSVLDGVRWAWNTLIHYKTLRRLDDYWAMGRKCEGCFFLKYSVCCERSATLEVDRQTNVFGSCSTCSRRERNRALPIFIGQICALHCVTNSDIGYTKLWTRGSNWTLKKTRQLCESGDRVKTFLEILAYLTFLLSTLLIRSWLKKNWQCYLTLTIHTISTMKASIMIFLQFPPFFQYINHSNKSKLY